ncbi:ttll-5 [Pristionchus pacificus]|uniref:Tubulin--tyrosine ligase-like protein 5 n=1 Tax=Pristionchus pacificus TaxID=54126 RepID=A0A2A6C1P0_PRIPA|nr:ttll-5 [Pristionchus pacificus]|eukprot:PDM72017.1 ttll-5 [Pristionchus pacificus]
MGMLGRLLASLGPPPTTTPSRLAELRPTTMTKLPPIHSHQSINDHPESNTVVVPSETAHGRHERHTVEKRRPREQDRFKRGGGLLPRLERMTVDDDASDSSRVDPALDATSSDEEMDEGAEMMETARPLQLLDFTPDSLNFVGKRVQSRARDKYIQIGRQYNLSFKMVRSESKLIKTILYSTGFTQVSARNPNFNILWTQRVNHFPRTGELTRKDRLYENIARSKALFGATPGGPFSFIPEFFVTPRDMDRLTRAMEDRRSRSSGHDASFIVKPVAGSRGKGIFLAKKPDEIPLASPLLVSRYISAPLTVNDHKFDLRVYVAVTSFYPLIAYVYTEGLTRLASEKYSRHAKEDDEYVHLTNYSVNKNSKNFVRNETLDQEDVGHKWTLGALLRRLEEKGIDERLLMLRIEDLVTKSLLSVQSTVSAACRSTVMHPSVCFELFGFDVLVDEQLKPWLLEVNLSPSLTCDAPLDSLVKTKLICDLFNLTGVQLISKKTINIINGLAKGGGGGEGDASGDWKDGSSSGVSSGTSSLLSNSGGGGGGGRNRRILTRAKIGERAKRILTKRVDTRLSTPVKRKQKSVKAYVRKAETELARRGDFTRIFPRERSMEIYGPLMENVGSERWDARLYDQLFPEGTVAGKEGTVADVDTVARLHNELIDTKRYPSFSSLSPDVASLLRPSYEAAGEYAEKLTKEGRGVYCNNALPSVRASARARTRSCVEWYESRMNEQRDPATVEITDGKVQVLDGKENALPSLISSSPSHFPPSTLPSSFNDEDALEKTVEKMTSEDVDALVSRYTELLLLEGLRKVVDGRVHSGARRPNQIEPNGALQLLGFASDKGAVNEEVMKSKVHYLLWKRQSYAARERSSAFDRLNLRECEKLLEVVNKRKRRFNVLPRIG